jgi:hypothetical protein
LAVKEAASPAAAGEAGFVAVPVRGGKGPHFELHGAQK